MNKKTAEMIRDDTAKEDATTLSLGYGTQQT
jgi:hypothetical protein